MQNYLLPIRQIFCWGLLVGSSLAGQRETVITGSLSPEFRRETQRLLHLGCEAVGLERASREKSSLLARKQARNPVESEGAQPEKARAQAEVRREKRRLLKEIREKEDAVAKAKEALTTNWIKTPEKIRGYFKLHSLLLLGMGGRRGYFDKKKIFQDLQSCTERIFVCDDPNNPLIKEFLKNEAIRIKFTETHVIPCQMTGDFEEKAKSIIRSLHERGIKPRVVMTIRDEWLQIAAMVAQHYGLPHQAVKAYKISQNKGEARRILRDAGIEKVRHLEASFEELESAGSAFGFPFFVKPVPGIRSEFARCIQNNQEWRQYQTDVLQTPLKKFILEEYLQGHEVDADIVLFKGKLLYGKISDNFPVFHPWALETGQLFPSILPKDTQQSLVNYAYEAARAFGYDRGVLHAELMLRKDGRIALIELNGRPGGMFIPNWHKYIWGVDLIKAQLAIAANQDPRGFLIEKSPTTALAQMCVTTKSDLPGGELSGKIRIQGCRLPDSSQLTESQRSLIYKAELWEAMPLEVDMRVSGHPILGELTVKGKTPQKAFRNLVMLQDKIPPVVTLEEGKEIRSSAIALRSFGINIPNFARFASRLAQPKDLPSLQKLLGYLASHVQGDLPEKLSETLVIYDRLVGRDYLIATAKLHAWKELAGISNPTTRLKTGYGCDLVVHPEYQKLGIGSELTGSIFDYAQQCGIGTLTLSCVKNLVPFYEKHGFVRDGSFMMCDLRDGVHGVKSSDLKIEFSGQENFEELYKLWPGLAYQHQEEGTQAIPERTDIIIARDASEGLLGAAVFYRWDELRPAPYNVTGYLYNVTVPSERENVRSGLIEFAQVHAQKLGIAKLTLKCPTELVPFYKKCGFLRDIVFMAIKDKSLKELPRASEKPKGHC